MTTDTNDGRSGDRDPNAVIDPFLAFDAKTCPMFLSHGTDDPCSPKGSRILHRALVDRGIVSELLLVPGRGHGVYGFDSAVEFMRKLKVLGPG